MKTSSASLPSAESDTRDQRPFPELGMSGCHEQKMRPSEHSPPQYTWLGPIDLWARRRLQTPTVRKSSTEYGKRRSDILAEIWLSQLVPSALGCVPGGCSKAVRVSGGRRGNTWTDWYEFLGAIRSTRPPPKSTPTLVKYWGKETMYACMYACMQDSLAAALVTQFVLAAWITWERWSCRSISLMSAVTVHFWTG